jgi:hypothetical protein
VGLQRVLTAVVDAAATLTATSADHGCRGRVIVAVFSGPQGVVEGVESLELELDVGVDAGGDADVGMAQKFLNRDEFEAPF